MAIASSTKIVPLVGSACSGPLGVAHLPRLWEKVSLDAVGRLPDGYDAIGTGFDAMTLKALELDPEEVRGYIRTSKPTYVQFEEWILKKKGGKIDQEAIKKHNAAVLGYNHADDKAKHMREDAGLSHAECTDAVTLNLLEDLHDFHKDLYRA